MSPEVYRLIHIGGALLLFLGLGGAIASAGGKLPRWSLAAHGTGLIALAVAGVGGLHKLQIPWGNWTNAKIAIWVLLAVVPTLLKKGMPRAVAVLLVVAAGVAAAWLARTKPF